jgi:hypothetical protein
MEFKCEKCDVGKVSDDQYGGAGLECVCAPGYKNVMSLVPGAEEIVTGCEQCGAGEAPSRDKTQCLTCDTATMDVSSPT